MIDIEPQSGGPAQGPGRWVRFDRETWERGLTAGVGTSAGTPGTDLDAIELDPFALEDFAIGSLAAHGALVLVSGRSCEIAPQELGPGQIIQPNLDPALLGRLAGRAGDGEQEQDTQGLPEAWRGPVRVVIYLPQNGHSLPHGYLCSAVMVDRPGSHRFEKRTSASADPLSVEYSRRDAV